MRANHERSFCDRSKSLSLFLHFPFTRRLRVRNAETCRDMMTCKRRRRKGCEKFHVRERGSTAANTLLSLHATHTRLRARVFVRVLLHRRVLVYVCTYVGVCARRNSLLSSSALFVRPLSFVCVPQRTRRLFHVRFFFSLLSSRNELAFICLCLVFHSFVRDGVVRTRRASRSSPRETRRSFSTSLSRLAVVNHP